MRISTIEEYGLRCALQLGRVYFFKEQHLAATEIAKREGISVRYVSKIMYLLRKAKLATAVRGTTGGFLLSKAPDQLALKAIIDALGAKKEVCADDFCTQFKGLLSDCIHLSECSVRPVWLVLAGYFDQVLGAVTLHELLARESEVKKSMEVIAFSKATSVKASLTKTIRSNVRGGQS